MMRSCARAAITGRSLDRGDNLATVISAMRAAIRRFDVALARNPAAGEYDHRTAREAGNLAASKQPRTSERSRRRGAQLLVLVEVLPRDDMRAFGRLVFYMDRG